MTPKFCRRHVIGPGVALLIFSSVSSGQAAGAIGNAPTVAPAPMVDAPLAPAVADTPGEQPSPQHHWVPGHWRWSEGAYVWETGRWEFPPAANVVWHAPQWRKEANGFTLVEGFWDDAPVVPVTVVRPTPAPAVAPQEIYSAAPPPPPQREIIVERPSPFHVWVSGYWGFRAGRHVWIGGRWDTPPRSNVRWIGPRWEDRGGRYVFIDGYWGDAVVMAPGPQVVVAASPAPGVEIVVSSAPPPPRREVIYARPGRDYVWIGGYWAWRGGRHVWIAGHYEMPPRGQRVWVEPRWERRGGSHIFIEGRWGR